MSLVLQQYRDELEKFKDGKLLFIEIPNYLFYPELKELADFKLSNNFKLKEYNISIANRIGMGASIKNSSPIKLYYSLINGLQKLSDHIRDQYPNFQIHIISGYRSPWVDRNVGGSGSGPHTRGWAVDVYFTGIDDSNKTVDQIRRGVAYEAWKLGIRGIELISGGVNIHFDPVRKDIWIAKQSVINGKFSYPLIDPLKELKPYQLNKFKI